MTPGSASPAPVVVGSIVDPGGVPRAKIVPAARLDAFADVGMGASPSWNVFCADDRLAFTPRFSVTGDLRVRIDRTAVRDLGDGVSWAPAIMGTQDGGIAAACTRTALAAATDRLSRLGVTALVGHEIEFTLLPADPGAAEPWSAYGLGAAMSHTDLLQDLLARAERADLPIVQLHAEYGPGQFEVSLAPRHPVAAADDVVLARTLVARAARAIGHRVSFSPMPVVGGAANGAHQHLSLQGSEGPLLSHGTGPAGLTDRGAAAIAGILDALPALGAVLSGSPVSGARLAPGMWAGAHVCWGTENREAAVRLVAATPANPGGAHIEIKPVDASANVYLATALLLDAARQGIARALPLPAEVTRNPVDLPARTRPTLLPTHPATQRERFATSPVAADLGADIVEAITAVRALEDATWGAADPAARAARFRFAWTP